jgi:hypothetical protein
MDQRQVFNNDKDLLSLVISISNQEQKAFLLVDREGLTRMEGFITSTEQQPDLGSTGILINHKDRVLLHEIIAINGVFRSDYSEC